MMTSKDSAGAHHPGTVGPAAVAALLPWTIGCRERRDAAEALAGLAGVALCVVDLERLLALGSDFEGLVQLVFREAWFQDTILYIEGLDELRANGRMTRTTGCLPPWPRVTGSPSWLARSCGCPAGASSPA